MSSKKNPDITKFSKYALSENLILRIVLKSIVRSRQ